MLAKFAIFAAVNIMVWYLVHLFAPNLYRGRMLNLQYHRGKCLVVKMDDKGSQKFWLDFFFMKTMVVVENSIGFLDTWNNTHKCSYSCFYLFRKSYIANMWTNPSCFVATDQPLQLVAHLVV